MHRAMAPWRAGSFPGIIVIADEVARSETMANSLSVVRTEIDEEHHMIFEPNNPDYGEDDDRNSAMSLVVRCEGAAPKRAVT
jgi:hypothetical protein